MKLKINDRVCHIDKMINNIKGIMTILEIKGDYAFCTSLNYNDFGLIKELFPLSDLVIVEN